MSLFTPLKNIEILQLEDIPPGTTTLDLSGCRSLTTLPTKLPDGIKTLNLGDCTSLTTLPTKLPDSLTELNLGGCTSLTTLPKLPDGLTKLNLENCDSLTTLPTKLPAGIEMLNLSRCTSLTTLPTTLPDGLTKLNLRWCYLLPTLPTLPDSLTELNLSRCTSLTTLPTTLPDGLTKLDLSGCRWLNTLPTLPDGIKTLNLGDCTSLTTLPTKLPDSLTELDIGGCRSLTTLPKLPDGLTKLDPRDCTSLTTLPTKLPDSLTELDLGDCTSLTTLPTLPAGIEMLRLGGCTSLTTLPTLPDGIKTLRLGYCTSLTTLPTLPAGIEMLNLTNCTSLTNSQELITQLLELERQNAHNPKFQLIWPGHLNEWQRKIDHVKALLTAAYKTYYANNPDFAHKEPSATDKANYPTFALFDYFMQEEAEVRGGASTIINSIIPTAEGIAKNPQMLKCIDETSKGFDGCVNQPVAGMTEVANLVNIATKEDIKSKMEAARALMAIDVIKSKASQLEPGQGVEVELGNAMLREVHKELLKQKRITQQWPGVPEGVAYERTIESFMTKDNIDRISDLVKDKLAEPLSQVAEYICEGNLQDFWATQVLTAKEIQEIDEQGTQEKVSLKKKIEYNDGNDELVNKLYKELEQAEEACRGGILALSREKTLAAIGERVKPDLLIHEQQNELTKLQQQNERNKGELLQTLQELFGASNVVENENNIYHIWNPQSLLNLSVCGAATNLFNHDLIATIEENNNLSISRRDGFWAKDLTEHQMERLNVTRNGSTHYSQNDNASSNRI